MAQPYCGLNTSQVLSRHRSNECCLLDDLICQNLRSGGVEKCNMKLTEHLVPVPSLDGGMCDKLLLFNYV
jgi:hypothetical protein